MLKLKLTWQREGYSHSSCSSPPFRLVTAFIVFMVVCTYGSQYLHRIDFAEAPHARTLFFFLPPWWQASPAGLFCSLKLCCRVEHSLLHPSRNTIACHSLHHPLLLHSLYVRRQPTAVVYVVQYPCRPLFATLTLWPSSTYHPLRFAHSILVESTRKPSGRQPLGVYFRRVPSCP